MNRNRIPLKSTFIPIMLLVFVCINACAEIRLGTIPSPLPSAKLRVFIMPVTGNPPHIGTQGGWARPHEQFKKDTFRAIGAFLKDTGIYEVVPEEDIRAVLGKQDVEHWQWLRNDLALVKQIGKALHADYAIISVRNAVSGWDYESKIICANLDSGKQYTDSYYVSLSFMQSKDEILSRNRKIFQASYQKMFHNVKEDLLATAFRKARLMPTEDMKKPPAEETNLASVQKTPVKPPIGGDKESPPTKELSQKSVTSLNRPPEASIVSMPQPSIKPASKPPVAEDKSVLTKEPLPQKTLTNQSKVIAKISPPLPYDLPSGDKRRDFEKKLEKELQSESLLTDKTKLVVHDFDTIERLNVVSLILTEALREELFILGRFRLVNREDMMQVLEELKLQQSGLVDDKQVVQIGKWLAANEAITGRLAVLANTYVIQAKRTDIQTLETLGLGSLRCVAGHEDELLSGMPDLARRLVGLYTTPHGNNLF